MSASNPSPEVPERNTGTPTASFTPPAVPEAAQGLQYPMHPGIPFFANPFMSPFMPQQPMETPTTQTAPPTQPYMFSPAQYQDMMQQYFQQMMIASQYGQTMPFPTPFAGPVPPRPSSQASQADSVNETVTALKNSSITENGHHEIPTATVAPIVPQSSSENGSPEKCRSTEENGTCSRESPTNDRSRTSSVKADGVPSSTETPERAPSISEDEKTASLIRKQMSEIEKEILRRSQNKNIKKIDDQELADLMGETAATTAEQFAFAANFAPDYTTQSGLPYTPAPPAAEKEVTPPKQTLNQLRSSFNLPESGPTTGPTISAASQPQPFAAPFIPAGPAGQQQSVSFPTQFVNPFGQTQAFVPNGSQFPEELASFLPAQAVPVIEQPTPPTGMGLAPPPPPSHPIHRKTSAPSTSGTEWPEENKENGDEPVWVLRDSYMKRLKRDEAAQQQQTEEFIAIPEPEMTEEERETDRLIVDDGSHASAANTKKKNSKDTLVHEPAVLIEGVLFRARYLGSTQMICETRSSKAARMHQAQEAVARVKAPDGEIQPSTEIDLFISTEKIMVLNTDLQRISETDVRQDILMDHALRTISYIADIGDLVVLMARRMSASDSDEQCNQIEGVKRQPKVICHVFESEEASFIAQSIGQAFQVAYVEFLRANGIDDPSYLRQIDYQEVLNSQELMGDELEMFARKETQKDVVVPKKNGEALGIVVVESGWGSMLPTVVLAHMNPVGPAARSNQLNVGDQIININGISLVGLPLSAAQTNIKNVKSATAVRLTVVSTPPVVEVRIRRPDTKYQLGFSVQNGVICSLLRGGIAERGGIRVGHRIIEINGQSVVAVAHDRIVNMLATAIGEIHLKTMPTSMFRLLTGQEVPQYI